MACVDLNVIRTNLELSGVSGSHCLLDPLDRADLCCLGPSARSDHRAERSLRRIAIRPIPLINATYPCCVTSTLTGAQVLSCQAVNLRRSNASKVTIRSRQRGTVVDSRSSNHDCASSPTPDPTATILFQDLNTQRRYCATAASFPGITSPRSAVLKGGLDATRTPGGGGS